ncbi:recombinase family protein [Paracraurococcus lichenis]|uniref:Recombinase family protein n=1 Tax=Paracraurococcus lichenis TaxID=3064888 RepID=A0ABT9EDU0_9PROT|nr:recombinase family protein [Paracraurococcus sp. LOR1-02]MDO9714396.1 recombinase family protein [Paracraurococcus sp. LOR1-02]
MLPTTAPVRFIAYHRVSTDRQGRSGLGLEAQRDAVQRHVAGAGGAILASFTEVESGKRNDRPELAKALAACRAQRATLVIAKLDRLARNARFLLSIVEGSGEGGVIFCDLPTVPAGPVRKFLITQMAAVAELEAGLIAQRTKAALAAAKARGVKLGNPTLRAGTPDAARAAAAAKSEQATACAVDLAPILAEIRAAGVTTLEGVAKALTARGIPTPSGREAWYPATVRRLQMRAA